MFPEKYQEKKSADVEISRPYRVLLPLAHLEEARLLLPFASMIVREQHGQLIILHVTTVHEGQPFSEAAGEAISFREAVGHLLSGEAELTAQIRTTARVESEVWSGIWETVAREDVDLLILGWRTPVSLSATAVNEMSDPQLDNPPCDIVAVRPAQALTAESAWNSIQRILIPARSGRNSSISLRIANSIARQADANITLLHVTARGREEQTQFFDEFTPAIHGLDRVTRSITTKGTVASAILEEAENHQLIILGAPSNPPVPGIWSEEGLDRVIAGTTASILVVKQRSPRASISGILKEPVTVQIERPVAVVVDQWFAENTYHSREFADLERLVALKEQMDVTISLGLPALNEEETVGKVIETVKKNLAEDFPLLDEIVLIDSGSVDYTREIAQDLGIPVYIHQEILPEYGAYRGKGEALWKSLYVLNGDIIAWIDTDIRNIHPRFVYGIVGPLLRDPAVQYVKGFYRRPLRQGDKLVAGGGGRVTELTARPLINLFFPELSGLIQPLSGEYAGRRSALERLPFFSGYGVETGLLIDLLDRFGLQAVSQVDLLERIHHNQPLPSLSKMSFAIMQVVISRLEHRHDVRLLDSANLTMNRIRYGPQRYYLEQEEIIERERPPMITIPEYRKIHGS